MRTHQLVLFYFYMDPMFLMSYGKLIYFVEILYENALFVHDFFVNFFLKFSYCSFCEFNYVIYCSL